MGASRSFRAMAAWLRVGHPLDSAHPAEARPRVAMIGTFQLMIAGQPQPLCHSAERVVAYLALAGRPVRRSRVAGELWPDVPEHRSLGNLRSALWRTQEVGSRVVINIGTQLSLAPEVTIDLADLVEVAEVVRRDPAAADVAQIDALTSAIEILSDWEEEWLQPPREQFRELWLHALDRVCDRFIGDSDYARAIEVGLLMVSADPFRESPRRLLVRAHLGEGNVADALRAYCSYRDLLRDELDVAPSALMEQVIAVTR
jgi:DNA-binding SARP family transcriptional activator